MTTLKKVSALLVKESSGEFSGIISTDDLLVHFRDMLKREDELRARPLSFYLPSTLF